MEGGGGAASPQLAKRRGGVQMMDAFYLREPANVRIFPLRPPSGFNLQISF